jgi:filamentous hemagglutinin family protein
MELPMTNVRTAYRSTNRRLLMSCATLALATAALAPQKARAQSAPPIGAFQGTISSSTNVSQNVTTPGVAETITVTNSSATIDWSATNNNFLPDGNIATFTSSSGITDYTVLNRITPVAGGQIQLNGRVISTLQGNADTTGGNIWFYSPSGIVVGSSAKFDVGGLLLTSLTPNLISNSVNGFSASFSRGDGDGGAIQILDGAQINALQKNSYIALVAPSIEQGGTVKVDGSAAYVAAEQVTTMTMDQGLFDIAVPFGGGSGAFTGISHTGTTTGGDTAAKSDVHRVYIAAVPKNEAITMLLGGTIGFDAGVAGYEDGQIRLSAGWTPTFNPDTRRESYTSPNNIDASIEFDAGNYLSPVDAIANGDIEAYTGGGDISFLGDVTLWSLDGDVRFRAVEGNIHVVGDASMFSSGGSEHEVLIYAGAGDITFDQNASLGAGFGWGDPDAESSSEDTHVANVTVETSGGTITAQNLQLHAEAEGQANAGGGDQIAGDGFGGDLKLWAYGGGTIKVLDGLYTNSSGTGGDMLNGSQGGGLGEAGNIYVWATGGTIDVDGYVTLDAIGTGGSYAGTGSPFTALGGEGRGGDIDVFSGEGGRVEFGNADTSVTLNAFGAGGNGQSGGAGYGGNAGFSGTGGFVVLPGTIDVNAWGTGGHANVGIGGAGGYAQGGTAYIEARAALGTIETAATYSTITGGNATLNASATGGNGGAGFSDGVEVFVPAGAGGDAQGGLYTGFDGSGGAYAAAGNAQTWGDTSSVLLGTEQGGQLTLGNVNLYAGGRGGAGGAGGTGQSGGDGGNGYGGSAQAGNYDPDENGLRTASATYGNLNMDATAVGGAGGAAGAGGAGSGDGGAATAGGYVACNDGDTCGGVTLNAKGTVIAASLNMSAFAQGGAGALGGDAQGGYGTIQTFGPDSSVLVNGGASLHAGASGGDGDINGGIATGGLIEAILDGGDITVHGDFSLVADAEGGDGLFGTGGAANGGDATLTVDGGAGLTVDGALELDVWANHVDETGTTIFGGSSSGEAGTAEGGDVVMLITDGAVSAASLGLRATSWGGSGLDDRAGGTSQGGNVTLTIGSAGSVAVAGASELRAVGQGGSGADNIDGAGGDGGSGYGGVVTVTVNGDFSSGTIEQGVRGVGGEGGNGTSAPGGDGGYGEGGTNTVIVGGTGSITGTYTATATAGGGSGGTGSTRGNGGDATGGTNNITIDGDASLGGSLNDELWSGFVATAFAGGGNGDIGGNATGGTNEITVNGSLTTTGLVQSTARAQGGAGDSQGGNATGGTASLTVNGTLEAEAVVVATTATGGTGPTAGSGTAGDSTFSINSDTGSAAVGQWVDVLSDGYSGSGAYGTGGDAAVSGPLDAQTLEMAGASISYSGVSADNWNFLYYGDAAIGDFVAQGFFAVEATGSLTTGDLTAGGAITLVAGSNLTTGDLLADYTPTITTAAVTSDDVNLSAGGDLSTGTVTTSGNISMDAGGSIYAGNMNAGLDVALGAGGASNVNDVTAQNANFTVGGTANFNGTVSATDITVTSRDINVAEGAQVGVWGVTDDLTFNAVSNGNPVLIGEFGDVADEGSYHFNESGDIAATTITFNAVAGDCECTPDFVIGDVNIDGSGSEFPAVSHVALNTDGSIFVEGIIDFHDAGADDSLALTAANSIEVNTDTGGISITDSSEAYVGTLDLTAHDIWVADSSVLGQLEENPNPANLADVLATNSGADNQGGYLRAGGIEATMLGSSFLVQNSGTADSYAGISVGDGGLTITNNGEDAANTIVHGRQVLANGTIVSGDEFAGIVDTSGTFTAGSTINGCSISGCGSTPPPPPPPCTTGCEPPPPPPPPVEPPPVTPPPPPVTPPPVTPPPVTPPPVTPPPVTPPPVTPPPVTPPPVDPPPFVPPQVSGAENILGPIGEMSSPLDLSSNDPSDDQSDQDSDDDGDDSDDQTNVDATLGLVNTGPVNIEQPIDQPITSGGDAGFGGDGPGGL